MIARRQIEKSFLTGSKLGLLLFRLWLFGFLLQRWLLIILRRLRFVVPMLLPILVHFVFRIRIIMGFDIVLVRLLIIVSLGRW